MPQTRRTFLKVVGAAGAVSLVGSEANADPATGVPGRRAVLVDTTLCVGCRGCEAACAEANGLPEPEQAGDDTVFEAARTTSTTAYTVVNRPVSDPERYIKRQCMHCLEPACASACLVRALEKTAKGPVVYHADRCLGCRYCMVACPFGVPRFEYEKPVPLVRKCTFCVERQAQGLEPACTSVCPSGALKFGDRDGLIEEARTRIYQNPDKYVHQIYGEREVGGTSWLYISDVAPEKLGLPAGLGTEPAAGYAQEALSGVPVVMTVGPVVLMGLYSLAQRREQVHREDENGKEEPHGK